MEKRDVALAQQLAKEHLDLTIVRLKNTINQLRALGIDPSKIYMTDLTNENLAFSSFVASEKTLAMKEL